MSNKNEFKKDLRSETIADQLMKGQLPRLGTRQAHMLANALDACCCPNGICNTEDVDTFVTVNETATDYEFIYGGVTILTIPKDVDAPNNTVTGGNNITVTSVTNPDGSISYTVNGCCSTWDATTNTLTITDATGTSTNIVLAPVVVTAGNNIVVTPTTAADGTITYTVNGCCATYDAGIFTFIDATGAITTVGPFLATVETSCAIKGNGSLSSPVALDETVIADAIDDSSITGDVTAFDTDKKVLEGYVTLESDCKLRVYVNECCNPAQTQVTNAASDGTDSTVDHDGKQGDANEHFEQFYIQSALGGITNSDETPSCATLPAYDPVLTTSNYTGYVLQNGDLHYHKIFEGANCATSVLVSTTVKRCDIIKWVDANGTQLPCPLVFPFTAEDSMVITNQADSDNWVAANRGSGFVYDSLECMYSRVVDVNVPPVVDMKTGLPSVNIQNFDHNPDSVSNSVDNNDIVVTTTKGSGLLDSGDCFNFCFTLQGEPSCCTSFFNYNDTANAILAIEPCATAVGLTKPNGIVMDASNIAWTPTGINLIGLSKNDPDANPTQPTSGSFANYPQLALNGEIEVKVEFRENCDVDLAVVDSDIIEQACIVEHFTQTLTNALRCGSLISNYPFSNVVENTTSMIGEVDGSNITFATCGTPVPTGFGAFQPYNSVPVFPNGPTTDEEVIVESTFTFPYSAVNGSSKFIAAYAADGDASAAFLRMIWVNGNTLDGELSHIVRVRQWSAASGTSANVMENVKATVNGVSLPPLAIADVAKPYTNDFDDRIIIRPCDYAKGVLHKIELTGTVKEFDSDGAATAYLNGINDFHTDSTDVQAESYFVVTAR